MEKPNAIFCPFRWDGCAMPSDASLLELPRCRAVRASAAITDKQHETDDQEADERQEYRERRFGEDRITGAAVTLAVSIIPVAITACGSKDWIRRNEEADRQNRHGDKESYTPH